MTVWSKPFDDFENEEQELAVAKQNLMSEPARADFTFSKLPLGIQPVDFMKTHFAETAGKSMQFRKGTTTLAFVYEPATPNDKGGIIVAVDSRASSGEYISSKSVMKILDIGDRMVATMAGGTMVAGYDKKGPQIFKVDSEGDRCQLKVCSVGSGSLNAYGILDNHYKPKMTDEEARKLGLRAIMHAIYRDSGSGGVCNLCHITPTEKIRLPPMDVSKLWYEFADELGKDIVYNSVDNHNKPKMAMSNANSASGYVPLSNPQSTSVNSGPSQSANAKNKSTGSVEVKPTFGYLFSTLETPNLAGTFFFKQDVVSFMVKVQYVGEDHENPPVGMRAIISNTHIQSSVNLIYERFNDQKTEFTFSSRFPQVGEWGITILFRERELKKFVITIRPTPKVFLPSTPITGHPNYMPVIVGESREDYDIFKSRVSHKLRDHGLFFFKNTPQVQAVPNKKHGLIPFPDDHLVDTFTLKCRRDNSVYGGFYKASNYYSNHSLITDLQMCKYTNVPGIDDLDIELEMDLCTSEIPMMTP